MKHQRHLAALVALASCAVFMAGGRADTLTFYDGREITGDVTKTDTGYVVKTKGGVIKVSAGDVAKWEKAAAAAVPTPNTPSAPGASQTPSPNLPNTGASPAAPPQHKFSNAEVMARVQQSIPLGVSAFNANDPQAALENFLDAYQALDRNGVKIDPNDPTHYFLLAGVGVAFMATNHFDQANPFLEKAVTSRFRDHAVQVNRAILDYTQHVNVLRSLKDVTGMLANVTDADVPQHEPEVQLLGAAIEYASRDDHNLDNKIYRDATDLYAHVLRRLEMAHYGQKLWAGRWLPLGEANPKCERYEREYAAWRASIGARDAASARLKNAEADFQRVKDTVGVRSAKSPAELGALELAHRRVNDAQAAYDAVKDQPGKLHAAIEWPEWPPFAPVKPDFTRYAALAAASVEKPKPITTFPVTRYAVAVPIASDLVLTAADVVAATGEVQLTTTDGTTLAGKLVRKDEFLALVRVTGGGRPLHFLKLAPAFTGGEIACWGLPEVTVINPTPTAIPATATPPRSAAWTVSVTRHPRLGGAAVVDKSGTLVGIALAKRDAVSTAVPAVPADQIRLFLGADAPSPSDSAGGGLADLVELRASH